MELTDFQRAKEKGISSPYAGAFLPFTTDDKGRIKVSTDIDDRQLAQDAALATAPNVAFPAALYTYLDPRIIDVLFGAMNAHKFFAPTKSGSWTDEFAQFTVEEITGETEPYADFSNAGVSDVNYNFPVRKQYRYQTNIKYGQMEIERAGVAKISLSARKQFASAQTIARAENKFQLYGVANMQIYGMLNDPNLPESITPISIDSNSTWESKVEANPTSAANIVFNDVNLLIAELMKNNGGHVSADETMILGIPNNVLAYLTIPNAYGKTALVLLKENYRNLDVVQLPELATDAGNMLYLVVPSLMGDETGFSAFSEKYRMSKLIEHTTWFEQKAMAGTYGVVIRRPTLIATMLGV